MLTFGGEEDLEENYKKSGMYKGAGIRLVCL
jgi:hypothetical protein